MKPEIENKEIIKNQIYIDKDIEVVITNAMNDILKHIKKFNYYICRKNY